MAETTPSHPNPGSPHPPGRETADGLFPPTLWSAILAAGDADAPTALQGLERLARAYWRPLYAFLRCRGNPHATAADLVQGFFAHLLSRQFLAEIRPGAGRFRNFLLVALRRWARDQQDRDRAIKRGGNHIFVPLDELDSAESTTPTPTASDNPEVAYERAWARDVFNRAIARVRSDWAARPDLFAALQTSLEGSPDAENYAAVGARLGLSEGAVKKAAYDLRQQFAAHVRAEIRSTVRDDAEVDAELRHLISLLRT